MTKGSFFSSAPTHLPVILKWSWIPEWADWYRSMGLWSRAEDLLLFLMWFLLVKFNLFEFCYHCVLSMLPAVNNFLYSHGGYLIQEAMLKSISEKPVSQENEYCTDTCNKMWNWATLPHNLVFLFKSINHLDLYSSLCSSILYGFLLWNTDI